MSDFGCNCGCRWSCAAVAVVVSLIAGIVAAFLQITAVLAVTPMLLWVALGVAVVYLGVLVLATALLRRREREDCLCRTLDGVLAGILGTVLFAVVLLVVDVAATGVIGAILVGLFTLFFALTLTSSACIVRCLADCSR